MQNLHRKISGEAKKNGKEVPIVPKGTQRLYVPVWACGCVSSALASSFASYHHIIPHSITSYIILHRWHELNMKSTLGDCFIKNENVLRHKVSWEIQLHQLHCKRRGSFVYEAGMFLQSTDIFTKYGSFFFMKHEKKGRCFFAEGSKRYV
jgi:hypothetical protein